MTTAVRRVVDALEARGCRPRARGVGITAHCPAHDDRGPSLSVSLGRDGRVLVHCFAGCRTPAILAALDLRWRDLFR